MIVTDLFEGAPISGDGGAVANFNQQMANNTEVAYQKNLKAAGVAENYDDEPDECWTCRGTGEGQHEGQTCSVCHGSGVEPGERDDDDFDIPDDYYEDVDAPWPFQQVNELSNEKLGQYKKAAGADATAADKRGDFERGNKRFRGITTATKKQFSNDIKKHYASREQGVAEGFSLNSISKFANIIPNFANKLVSVGKQEATETWKMLQILNLKRQGKATPAQIKFMNEQWKDIAVIALGVGLAGQAAVAGAAHAGAAGAATHVAKDELQHSLIDGGLEYGAEVLAVKFGIDIVKKIAHALSTSSGRRYDKSQEVQQDAPIAGPASDANVERMYANARGGFGGVAEATGDPKFDKMLKGITAKKAVAKQQKADAKQQAQAAFGGMFGGGNPADKLKIKEQGVAENSLNELSPDLLQRSAQVAKNKSNQAMDPKIHDALGGGYTNRLAKHYDSLSQKFSNKAVKIGQRDAVKKIASPAVMRKIGMSEQGVAEGLNEFAPGGQEGNGPFDYGSAIVQIGEDYTELYNDDGDGADAARIIKVGKTFMDAGMTAGINAFYAMDTMVRDHVAEQLQDLNFNVRQDIYLPYRQGIAKKTADGDAKYAAHQATPAGQEENRNKAVIKAVIVSGSKNYQPGHEVASLIFDKRKQDVAQRLAEIKKEMSERFGPDVKIDYQVTIGGNPVQGKEQGVAEVKQRLDPKCWTGKHKEGTKIKGGVRVNNCVPNESTVNEFAPPGGDDGGPDEDEILFRLAKQWWLGTEQDMIRAERTLASMGWEIGEDEGSYDDGGVFVVRAGDVNGRSYQSWPHEELVAEGVAEGFVDSAKKLATGAALAGSLALGGGAAHAQNVNTTQVQSPQAAVAQAKIDYTKAGPITQDSMGQKLEYGIPVNAKGDFFAPSQDLPDDEYMQQIKAYKTWKSDFTRRWPSAKFNADGSADNGTKAFGSSMMPFGGMPKIQENITFKLTQRMHSVNRKLTNTVKGMS